MDTTPDKKRRPPPVVEQKSPERELEKRLREHPDDRDAMVDVGSDESMDASDPVSISLPEHRQPAPSSGFEDDEPDKT